MNDMKPNTQPVEWDNSGYVDKVSRGGGIRHNTDMVSKYQNKVKEMDQFKQAQFLNSFLKPRST